MTHQGGGEGKVQEVKEENIVSYGTGWHTWNEASGVLRVCE